MSFRRLAGPGVALLLLAAACSGGSDSGSDTEAAATAETTETATEAPSEAPSEVSEPDPTAPPTDETESDAGEAVEAVQVEITTSDGETLTANYTAVPGAPGVVLGHMRGTGKETWDAFAKAASGEGFAVLAIDSRGYGGSTGERDTNLDIDLTAGIDFLLGEGSPSVAVFGASMNGTATVVVGSQTPVAGIATLSAPAEFAGLDAVAAAPAVSSPSLIIVAEDDEPYASAAPALVGGGGGNLVLYPGSAHGTALFDEHAGALTAQLIEFLTEVTG